MGEKGRENKELTPRQVRALAELASGASVPATAEAVGVAAKTVRAWLKLDHFAAELRRLQDEQLRGMARQLTALGDMAAEAVKRGLDPGQPMGQQLRAAALVYDRGPALLELADLAERMTALERRLDENSTK